MHENHVISTTTTSLDMIQNEVVDDPTLQRSKDQVEGSDPDSFLSLQSP